jgi:hypothetical protein
MRTRFSMSSKMASKSQLKPPYEGGQSELLFLNNDIAARSQETDQNTGATGQRIDKEIHKSGMSAGDRNLKQLNGARKQDGNDQPREQPSAAAQILQRPRKREAYEVFELVRRGGNRPHDRWCQGQEDQCSDHKPSGRSKGSVYGLAQICCIADRRNRDQTIFDLADGQHQFWNGLLLLGRETHELIFEETVQRKRRKQRA